MDLRFTRQTLRSLFIRSAEPAYHEAGHFLTALYLGGKNLEVYAENKLFGRSTGNFSYDRCDPTSTSHYDFKEMVILYGGQAAVELIFNAPGSYFMGALKDYFDADEAAKRLQKNHASQQKVDIIKQSALMEARRIIIKHQNELHAVAKILKVKKSLTGEEAVALLPPFVPYY